VSNRILRATMETKHLEILTAKETLHRLVANYVCEDIDRDSSLAQKERDFGP
jgi:hypothetical protein